mmetsp:Transcript_24843/g.32453  ORF Transcript_24843/g.32453 Transcript_24843/m.32453 type:complete len:338 (+) Transcript_24843:198-1211(+)
MKQKKNFEFELDLESVEKRFSYRFCNKDLLKNSLTCRSISGNPSANTHRLSFLGDGVFKLLVRDWVCEKYPESQEGDLTKMTTNIECEIAQAEYVEDLQLQMQYCCQNMGRPLSTREMATVLESVIGAIFLDGGYIAAKEVAMRIFEDYFTRTVCNEYHHNKNKIQENFPSSKIEYNTKFTGPAHDRRWQSQLIVDGKKVVGLPFKKKKDAEKSAAQNFIEKQQPTAGLKRPSALMNGRGENKRRAVTLLKPKKEKVSGPDLSFPSCENLEAQVLSALRNAKEPTTTKAIMKALKVKKSGPITKRMVNQTLYKDLQGQGKVEMDNSGGTPLWSYVGS